MPPTSNGPGECLWSQEPNRGDAGEDETIPTVLAVADAAKAKSTIGTYSQPCRLMSRKTNPLKNPHHSSIIVGT